MTTHALGQLWAYPILKLVCCCIMVNDGVPDAKNESMTAPSNDPVPYNVIEPNGTVTLRAMT